MNSIKMDDVKVFHEDDGEDDPDKDDKEFEGGDDTKADASEKKVAAPAIPELSKAETAKLESMVKSLKDEKMFAEQNDKLALTKDIYAYTFYNFVKNPNPVFLGELMIKCFFTIMLQMAIITFKFEEAMGKKITVNRGDADLNIIRIVCAFVMHLYTYPEVRLAQQMTQFALYNAHKFPEKRTFFPLLIATMKIVGALSAEIGNIYYISGYTTVS